MSDDTLIADLIAAGTPPMLVQRVALEVMRAQLEREALERRKEQDRDRQSRRRRLSSRDVTLSHEQNVTNRDVTASPASPLDGPPLPPAPPSPPLNPPATPGSEAIASAPAAAGPKAKAELTVSDRVWVDFPAVLADMGKRSEESVRKWLGKLLAKYAAEDVYHALSATVAAGTGDPFGYTMRILHPIQPKSRQPARRPTADLWASDAAEAHLELNGGRHDERPFDTDTRPWDRSGDAGGGRSDEPPSQQVGTDPRRFSAVRVISGGRA